MEIAKLTSKGQITIPKTVREDLCVTTGDKLIFIKCDSGYLVCNGANFNVNSSVEDVIVESGLTPAAVPAATPAPASAPVRPARPAEYYYDDGNDEYEKPKKKKDKDKDKKKKKKKK